MATLGTHDTWRQTKHKTQPCNQNDEQHGVNRKLGVKPGAHKVQAFRHATHIVNIFCTSLCANTNNVDKTTLQTTHVILFLSIRHI